MASHRGPVGMAGSRGLGALALAIELLWWLLLAAVVAGGALLVLLAAHVLNGGGLGLDLYFQLPAAAYHLASGALSAAPASLGVSSGQVAFRHPRAVFVLVSGGVLALTAGVLLFVVFQLRSLLGALRDRRTFERENAVRLRRIGIAVIAFELAHALAVWAGGLYLDRTLVARGMQLRAHFRLDLPVILLGLLLLALAAAFRVGSELAEEQALTV